MSDFLLEKGNKAPYKKLFKSIGVPVPTKLKRITGSWTKDVLSGKTVATGIADGGIAVGVYESVYKSLGGGAVESSVSGGARANALVFDGTGIKTIPQLKQLYEFFKGNVKKIDKCARIIIICAELPTSKEASGIASIEDYVEFCSVQQGLEGFSRSLAKEVGAKGATVNLLRLSSNTITDKALAPYLHFLFSDGGAFISGQVISVDVAACATTDVPLAKSLEGKTALVTGSARGIGEGTARRLALEGATVVILDRPQEAESGNAVAASIGGKFLGVDMSGDDAGQTIIDFINKELGGGVDIVVHNAGITRDKTIGNMDAAAWDMVISVNLNAIFQTNKALLAAGVIKDGGRIVSLSSTSGVGGNFGQTNYAVTKAGVIGYVKSLSESTAAKGITVNAIAPGFIETAMTAKIPGMTKFFGRRLSALSQGGVPADIANMITFLSTPGASGTTGQTIRVCGGNFLGK